MVVILTDKLPVQLANLILVTAIALSLQIAGRYVIRDGKPGEGIIKLSKEHDADMIVVGTRGLGKVRRTVLGSVSSYVIHHAHVPVVVCRPRGEHNGIAGGRDSDGKRERRRSGNTKSVHCSDG